MWKGSIWTSTSPSVAPAPSRRHFLNFSSNLSCRWGHPFRIGIERPAEQRETPWPFVGGWTQGSHPHLAHTGNVLRPRPTGRPWPETQLKRPWSMRRRRRLRQTAGSRATPHWDLQIYKPLRFPIATYKCTDQRQVKFNRPVLRFSIFLYGNRLPRCRIKNPAHEFIVTDSWNFSSSALVVVPLCGLPLGSFPHHRSGCAN